MKISIGSGFNKRLGYRQWIYSPMAAIPVNTALGQIIGLDVVPASDGSGNYVWVVRLDNADIEIGTVDVNQTYHVTPPILSNGDTVGFQSDVNGNLKVNIAGAEVNATIGTVNQGEPGNIPWPVAVASIQAGSNTIGAINQGVGGSSAWKVDPSHVTSPVSLAAELPAGTNVIGGTLTAATASSAFAITPGASSALETGHVLKASAGNLYSLYVMTTSVAGFLMTFNAISVPADGPVTPVECIPVGPNSIVAVGVDGSPPDHYSAGIVAVFSTTGPFVKTTTVSGYGMGPYGRGPYSTPALAFFKWSIV
jgi:hypothetical protein